MHNPDASNNPSTSPASVTSSPKFIHCLQTKMMFYSGIWFTVVLVIVNLARIYGLPFTPYDGEYTQRQQEIYEQLNLIADLKKDRLLDWLAERNRDAEVLSDSQLLSDAIIAMQGLLNESATKGNTDNTTWETLLATDTYRHLNQHLQLVKQTYRAYASIQIVDLETAVIITSTLPEEVGTDLSDQAFFQAARATDGLMSIKNTLSENQFNLFIARQIYTNPALAEEQPPTALLLLNIDDAFLADYLKINQQMGETGEAILISQDLRVLTSLRYTDTTDQPARHLSVNLKRRLAKQIAAQQFDVLNVTDYRNQPVLATYRSVPINANINWGLVVKVDQKEAFAPLAQSMLYSFLIGVLFSGLLGIIFTYGLARTVTRPIEDLIAAMQKIEAGDFNARATTSRRDEVGVLARMFNTMVDRVQHAHTELESLVRKRTAELHTINFSLEMTVDEMKDLNAELEQEIADRQKAEAEVRRKQREQQIIFDSVPALILRKDTQNNVLWMNKAAADLLGVEPDPPNGCYSLAELLPEQADSWYAKDLKVMETCHAVSGIVEGLTNAVGQYRWLQLDKLPYWDEQGNLVGIVVLGMDITGRLRAEQAVQASQARFQAVVDTAVDGIVMINAQGVIQLLNPALAHMFGYEKEDLQGHPIKKLMPNHYAQEHDQYIKNYFATRKAKILGVGREIVGKRKDGSFFPIHLAVSETIINEQPMFVGILSDITELKQAQAALEDSKRKLEIQNRAYSRFVPREFLSFLGKNEISDVQLGDQVQQEMSVMFSDIRQFTALSEKMTPHENFQFINAYLSKMEPLILNNHGFIDKYIGDAIMALFPTSADDALRGGVAMLQELSHYNERRSTKGYAEIDIGIGIHTGILMLGTIGGMNRMDSTVISDAVNLASRVEGLTKMYGASLLITEHTYNNLVDVDVYSIRVIDKVKVKGKTEPVIVFEVLDGYPPKIREAKMETLDLFTQAFIAYQRRFFDIAEADFQICLDKNPADKAAEIYIKRCQFWDKYRDDPNWDGITELESKEFS